MGKGNNSEAIILRQKAEEFLKKKLSKTDSQLSGADMLKLIHELEVHQIELELQTEEIILARSAALSAAEKFTELYDFSPSGSYTLSRDGKIIELNLSGANMLGKDRLHLKNSRFGSFVTDDTKQIFNLFLSRVFKSKAKESSEMTLLITGKLPMYVQLIGIAAENEEQCLVTMFDITERKLAEEALLKSEENLRKINIEKDKYQHQKWVQHFILQFRMINLPIR